MDLEARNTALQTELDTSTPLSRKQQDPINWLPRSPPLYALQSHREAVTSIAFHPVFSWLASASEDCTIKIWDWESGDLERTIKGHTRTVSDVDFGGPRGATLLASCSSDLTIKLWDPADEFKNTRTLPGHDHSVSCVRFIPTGEGAGGSGSGNTLVSASRDQTLKIWDATTGYCLKTLSGHAAWVRVVAPSSDGRYLLSGSDDFILRLWDIDATTPETKMTLIGHQHRIECCAFAPPSAYPYLAPLAQLKKPPPPTSTAEFMATGSRDKTIRLWDSRGTCIKELTGHDSWVRGLVFHPGGKFLLSVSDDKTLRCWDFAQEGRCVRVLRDDHTHFVSCLRWAPSVLRDATAAAAAAAAATQASGTQGASSANGANGTAAAKKLATAEAQIRCVIATGSVDMSVRIFAN